MPRTLFLDSTLTRTIGRCDSSKDAAFNDMNLFPDASLPETKGIKQIDVFSDKIAGGGAVITGLTIVYDGVDEPISHGTVLNVNNVGTLTIDPEKTLLVGVSGRLKDLPGDRNDGRIASIGFVTFDKREGSVKTRGPYQGTTERQGTAWVTVGPVVALHGATKDGIGLTTLGFVKGRKNYEGVEIF